jgi:protein-L-isoaspartate(D-aspartate) O-methyltransferase
MTIATSEHMLYKRHNCLSYYGLTLCVLVVLAGCGGSGRGENDSKAPYSADVYTAARLKMVRTQIVARGVTDSVVVAAMRRVPRHLFVPEEYRASAYSDTPLPIGLGQTISQPYVVALMTEALELKGGEKVFEVGTGSGYQAAVLAEMGAEVYTMEIVEELAEKAAERLKALGYSKVHVRAGDAYQGWVEHSPFDAVIVTAAPDHIPQPLVDQLKVGGRMVIPVGEGYQDLILLTKTRTGVVKKSLGPVVFVPMTGQASEKSGNEK